VTRAAQQRSAGTNGNDPTTAAADAVGPEAQILGAVDPLALGEATAKLVVGLALNPLGVLQALGSYASGLVGATSACAARALGVDAPGPVEPGRKDKRFGDPTWQENPAYFWLLQNYLLFGRLAQDLVEAGAGSGPGATKLRLATEIAVDALAPTNVVPGNPAALKRAFETGGASLRRGARNFVTDLATNRGMPRQVDRGAFTIGKDLAATQGKVVFRNDLIELLQYAAQTETVHEVPLLCSPPWINKYYVMDLAPRRSFIEWAVQHGHTVFAISYRNADASMRDVTLDDYLVHGPSAALDAIEEITGAGEVNIVGLCLGGTLTSMLLAYLEKTAAHRVRSATLLNTLIDFSEPGVLGAFTDPATIDRVERKMRRTGFLPSDDLARTFTFLRGNDLVWNYVVNNWLLGEPVPRFDILAWNDDATRMPAEMHAFYLRSCYGRNAFARGELELAGELIGAGDIRTDTFILAAVEDHIVPWTSSYASTRLLSGDVRFVLSSAGHIAGIVNPPSPKSRYWTNDELPLDPNGWRTGAELHEGSWWEEWTRWAAERSGGQREPPPLGSERHPPLGDAPGTYIVT
jgi:polyhydroxyalkanoate synthase subunit PhaC